MLQTSHFVFYSFKDMHVRHNVLEVKQVAQGHGMNNEKQEVVLGQGSYKGINQWPEAIVKLLILIIFNFL